VRWTQKKGGARARNHQQAVALRPSTGWALPRPSVPANDAAGASRESVGPFPRGRRSFMSTHSELVAVRHFNQTTDNVAARACPPRCAAPVPVALIGRRRLERRSLSPAQSLFSPALRQLSLFSPALRQLCPPRDRRLIISRNSARDLNVNAWGPPSLGLFLVAGRNLTMTRAQHGRQRRRNHLVDSAAITGLLPTSRLHDDFDAAVPLVAKLLIEGRTVLK